MRAVRRRLTDFGIPYEWTSADKDAQQLLREVSASETLARGRANEWSDYAQRYPARDFLGDLYASGVTDPDSDWTRLRGRVDAGPNAGLIIDTVNLRIYNTLHERLLRLVESQISNEGGVLYYTDRLDRCLVYEYEIGESKTAATITACAQIEHPNILYDVDTAIDNAEEGTRAALKNALVYGHKVVAHRNTMVHVDRRRDVGTAGPFIDTLILNEMLHKYVYECSHLVALEKAVEIGSGSGMLICSCAQNLFGLKWIGAIDTEIGAVHCAYRNFTTNNPSQEMLDRFIAICGRYGCLPLPQVDLALCNPPYLPEPPGHRRSHKTSAIAGTELMTEVLASLPKLLTNGGVLFLIFSDLARKEFDEGIEKAGLGFETLGPKDGFPVRLDQPEVLSDPDWLQFLMERGLDGGGSQHLHVLHCAAVHKSQGQGFDDTHGIIQQITTLNQELEKRAPNRRLDHAR